jgi:hypothetical protein
MDGWIWIDHRQWKMVKKHEEGGEESKAKQRVTEVVKDLD